MDWKYKHFNQERVFAAPREEVAQAARVIMAESLGWQVADRPDGLTAQGYSFSHRAIANLHIQTVSSGTRVAVELLVERAGWRGFMLFDAGGYYNIQIRKWLDGIQWSIHHQRTGAQDESQNPVLRAENKTAAFVFNGVLMFVVVMFGLYFFTTFIEAVVGLTTGSLFLIGRGTLTIHGIWARVISALILLFGGFVVWKVKRGRAIAR